MVHAQRQRLLTQRQAEAQSPCKVQAACGPPEARQLRVGQRLGQLDDATHVGHEIIVVVVVSTEQVVVQTANTGREVIGC